MNSGADISYLVAFFGGMLMFLSPCLLPLIPSFIAYITGVSFADLKDADKRGEVRKKTIAHALLFILGFSIVFVLLGLTATVIGRALFRYQTAIRITGGVLITLFGLYLTGILKLDFLGKELRLNLRPRAGGYISSFLIGVTFAAAWTPCAGPLLGSILVLAGTKDSVLEGAKLLSVFSLGIAVPFLATALAVNSFLAHIERIKKVLKVINVVGGVFLIIVGILVATNYLSVISNRLFAVFAGR